MLGQPRFTSRLILSWSCYCLHAFSLSRTVIKRAAAGRRQVHTSIKGRVAAVGYSRLRLSHHRYSNFCSSTSKGTTTAPSEGRVLYPLPRDFHQEDKRRLVWEEEEQVTSARHSTVYSQRGTWPTRPACCTEKRLCRAGSVPIGHPAGADSKSTENTRRRAGYCVSGLVSWRAAICRRVHRQHVPGYIAEAHSPGHSTRETRKEPWAAIPGLARIVLYPPTPRRRPLPLTTIFTTTLL